MVADTKPGVQNTEHTQDIGAYANFHSSGIASLVTRVYDLTWTVKAMIAAGSA